MKNRRILLTLFHFKYLLAALVLSSGLSYSQSDLWFHFFSHNNVQALASDGDYLWIGYDYGLEHLNISTGESELFFRENSGLPCNDIISLAVDKKGNTWIVTGNLSEENPARFLVKYDGKDWTVFDTTNSGMPDLSPMVVSVDSLGNIWVGMYMCVVKFDGQKWTVYDPRPKLRIYWISTMSLAGGYDGTLWIGTSNWGLVRLDSTGWKEYVIDKYPPEIWSIAVDSAGNKWLATQGLGLMKFDGSDFTAYNTSNSEIPTNYLTSLCIDSKGNIWTGHSYHNPFHLDPEGGLAKFDGTKWTHYDTQNSGLPSIDITKLACDRSDNIWIGTMDKSLAKFGGGSKWQLYNSSNSTLPSNIIDLIAVGPDGSKWFGTRNGLAVLKADKWLLFDPDNSGLPAKGVHAVAFDSLGNAWVGTDSGLAKFDGIKWTVYNTENSGLTNNYVGSIAIDRQGNKWIATGFNIFVDNDTLPGGLAMFNDTTWKIYDMRNSPFPVNSISSVIIDSSGNKWVTYKGIIRYMLLTGLLKFDDSTWTRVKDNESYQVIQATVLDKKGRLWIGGQGFGLARYDGNDWIYYNTKNSGLPDDNVTSIAFDSENTLWAGTGKGLAEFDTSNNWNVYNTDNSKLTGNNILAVALDEQDCRWISVKGAWVSIFRPARSVVTYAEDRQTAVKKFSLSQNYPNPFNPETVIRYSLPEESAVKIKLFDILGREVKILVEEVKPAGSYHILLNSSGLTSGVYFYRIEAGKFTETKKLLILR